MYRAKLKKLIEEKLVKIPHGVDLNTFYPINSQRKKDKDDGSNDTLSGDTKQLQGKKQKDEHMPANVDNNADNLQDCSGQANVAAKEDSTKVLPVDFKFLSNKGFRHLDDRGGTQYLIRAYLEEFKKEEDVELILKINPAYGIPNLLEMFPELKGDIPKIRFIPENYTKKQLNDLYNECDVFVSPTRAEAFNLPVLEALACGKPVITTNYGGQTDFIDNKCGWLIDYKLENAPELEFEGVKWATPDIKDLRKKLRSAFMSKDGLATKEQDKIVFYKSPKELGDKALKVAKKLTWENTAKQIHNLIK